MRNIAKINENDRKALFHNTAAKMGMTDAINRKGFLGVLYARLSFSSLGVERQYRIQGRYEFVKSVRTY